MPWMVLRLIFCAILPPGSCLHLHYLPHGHTQEQKSGTHILKYLIPSFNSIKVNTTIHEPSIPEKTHYLKLENKFRLHKVKVNVQHINIIYVNITLKLCR